MTSQNTEIPYQTFCILPPADMLNGFFYLLVLCVAFVEWMNGICLNIYYAWSWVKEITNQRKEPTYITYNISKYSGYQLNYLYEFLRCLELTH